MNPGISAGFFVLLQAVFRRAGGLIYVFLLLSCGIRLLMFQPCFDRILICLIRSLICYNFMLPSADQLFKNADFIFQQDLAPAHTAKSTKRLLNDHGVGVLDWPANSPDLNPIEQWFSNCGTRTTSGTWDSSSGTQRNLRIKYKSGRVSTKAIFFFFIVLNGSVFFMLSTRAFFSWHREFKNVSTHHCHFLVS